MEDFNANPGASLSLDDEGKDDDEGEDEGEV